MSDMIWLHLDASTSVSYPRHLAMALDREGFVKLYRTHVHAPGRKGRKEAEFWADEQIKLREEVLRA